MNAQHPFISPGIASALGAALLFGAGTPLAKLLLQDVSPWLLAGLFYLGSGAGLSLYRLVSKAEPVRLPRTEAGWFAGAILANKDNPLLSSFLPHLYQFVKELKAGSSDIQGKD